MKKKILIVDDSDIILMVEKMILKRGKFEIIVAKDGIEAVEKADTLLPDLILLDIIMPNMNGFEVCSRLKTQEKTKNIPIIMVTTRGEEKNIEKAFDCGCSDYITKPIDATQLLSKVEQLLNTT